MGSPTSRRPLWRRSGLPRWRLRPPTPLFKFTAAMESVKNFPSKDFIAKRAYCDCYMGAKAKWIGQWRSDSSRSSNRSVPRFEFRVPSLNPKLATRNSKPFFERKEKNCAAQESLFRRLWIDRVLAQV